MIVNRRVRRLIHKNGLLNDNLSKLKDDVFIKKLIKTLMDALSSEIKIPHFYDLLSASKLTVRCSTDVRCYISKFK